MACQYHLKIAACHHFDATGNNQVDCSPRPAGSDAVLQTKQSMWEKAVTDVFAALRLASLSIDYK